MKMKKKNSCQKLRWGHCCPTSKLPTDPKWPAQARLDCAICVKKEVKREISAICSTWVCQQALYERKIQFKRQIKLVESFKSYGCQPEIQLIILLGEFSFCFWVNYSYSATRVLKNSFLRGLVNRVGQHCVTPACTRKRSQMSKWIIMYNIYIV